MRAQEKGRLGCGDADARLKPHPEKSVEGVGAGASDTGRRAPRAITLLRMDVREPPYPEYLETVEVEGPDYRVVFWSHQLPPAGILPAMMGWSELTRDVVGAKDLHEVISWAESYLVEFAAEYPGQEHRYCMYAKVPEEGLMLRLVGRNPTISGAEDASASVVSRPPPDDQ